MNKTQHYQLNQWDPEDRILRVDFNADNAAVDAALHTISETAANSLAQEASARSTADTAIRTDFAAADSSIRADFAAADNTIKNSVTSEATTRANQDAAIRSEFAAADTKIRTDFAAADNTIKSSVTSEATTRANQDAAIRKEFAAADATLRSENMLVKLTETTTTSNAAQVNVSVSGLNLHTYRKIMIIPTIKLASSAQDTVRVRLNNLSGDIYYQSGNTINYFLYFNPAYNYLRIAQNSATEISLFPGGHITGLVSAASGQTYLTMSSLVAESSLAPSAITALNFYCASGTSIGSGSKISIYGVK